MLRLEVGAKTATFERDISENSTNGRGTDHAPHEVMGGDNRARAGDDIRERAFRFACRIVKFCQQLYETDGVARAMTPQLLGSGTALYAMLEEARAAESRRDFISKCAIGLKEIREAYGRLRIHEACEIGPPAEARELRIEASALISIVTAIVSATRANAGLTPRRNYFKSFPNSQFLIPNS